LSATSEHCRQYRAKLKIRAYANYFFGECCVKCHSTEKIELAHLKPTGLNGPSRGLTKRYLDVIKHPESYQPMCKDCHTAFDKRKAEEVPF